MHYQVSRNGQMYGPYTLDDLRRYIASGNVLPTDLCKSEEMPDWLPVSQVLGETGAVPTPGAPGNFTQPVYDTGAGYGAPASYNPTAVAASPYPDPPNLGWGWYLVLTILTCTLFSKVYFLIQSAWLRRVQPNSVALFINIGVLVLDVCAWLTAREIYRTIMLNGGHMTFTHSSPSNSIFRILGFALLIWGRFAFSSALEEHFRTVEPLGIELNPVLTFFFGGVYFQSIFNRINATKQAARFGAPRPY